MSAAGRAVGGVLQYTADHQHGTGGAWPAGRAVPREDGAPGAQLAVIRAAKGVRSQRGRAPQPRSNRCLPPITGYHATLMATVSPHPAPPRRATSHSQHFQGHTTWLPLQTAASLLTASN